MPALGKCSDELRPGDARSGWYWVALADPDRLWGMFGARRRRAGDKPGDSAQQGSGRARIDADDRPGTTTEGVQRVGEPTLEVRGPGCPGAAAPGRTIRATGPPRGTEPPLARCAAIPAATGRTGDGWSTSAHVPTRSGFSSHGGSSPGSVAPPASSAGPRVRGGRRDNAVGAPGRSRTAGRGPGGTGAPLRPRIRVTCPVAHSRSTRPGGRRLLPEAVGCSDVGAAAQAPGKPPRARDPPWRDGPGHPNRQVCETGTNSARPTRSTTTISHPRPPNTAITTTAPPPRLLRHSQPANTQDDSGGLALHTMWQALHSADPAPPVRAPGPRLGV